MILRALIKSDERIKKLLKLEEIEQLKVKFKKHPESKEFYDTRKKCNWIWSAHSNKKIAVALDKNNSIVPHDKDERLFVLAHELGHLLLGIFPLFGFRNCKNIVNSCFSVELQAHAICAELLRKINVQFDVLFWSAKLKSKQEKQCKKCLKIIKKGGCPEAELAKIIESLNIIKRNIKK